MPIYRLETQINTSQHFLMLADGVAEEFTLGGFTFKAANKNFDKRAGFRYFANANIEAENRDEAYNIFLEKILRTTDTMAFFYSQPVSVEYWNILIRKDDEPAAYLSSYKLRPTTSMRDYNVISDDLVGAVEAVNNNDDLYNIVWLYNNNAKIDSVDYDPGSRQFGLCQLVEALADEEEVPMCESCQKGGYKRTVRSDIKTMLDMDLYKKLYGGGNILRNRLAHGSLTSGTFLGEQDVEDIILKVSDRINKKYGLRNKVQSSVQDRIRATNTWTGHAIMVNHGNIGLEDFLEQFHLGTLTPINSLPRGW